MSLASTLFAKPQATTPERRLEADSDWLIVQRVQAGQVAEFDQLILKYRERVYGMIYHMTSNREDAADLTQDAFIKTFQSINRFQGQCAFFTWLYRIALNSTLTHLRKSKLRSFFSFDQVAEDETTARTLQHLTAKSGVEREVWVNELQERLNEAMQKLSTNHRTVITLFEIDGLSHEEIAEIMHCSVGTVRSRLHYAKQQLQADLMPYLN